MSRTPMVVGRIGPEGRELAYYCAWGGGHWMTEEDAALADDGLPVSHGICGHHQRIHFPGTVRADDGPEAA